MTERPRDWDKELADIDRVIEKEGGRPGALPARVPATAAPAVAKRSAARTWFWALLALLLAIALPIWPYGKECGLQLFFYLGAATLALLAGAAGAFASWGTRTAPAHVVSLLVIVWSGAMGLREILPRTGYAAQAKTWFCPSAPEPAPEPAPVPAPPTESAQPSPTKP